MFPDARYVNVIRDGRAVANSWLQMDWWLGYRGPGHWHFGPLSPEHQEVYERSGRSFVVLAGLAWVLLMDAFEAAKADLGELRRSGHGSTCAMRTCWPTPAVRSATCLHFLGLPDAAAFRRRLRRLHVLDRSHRRLRRDLDPASLKALEDIVGPTLARYGYR